MLDRQCGLPIHLETSGVDPLQGRFDWVTLSPKSHQPPLPSIIRICDELKVIIHGSDDLKFAEEVAAATKPNVQHFLQPGWESKNAEEMIINYILANNQWKISLQMHKILSIS